MAAFRSASSTRLASASSRKTSTLARSPQGDVHGVGAAYPELVDAQRIGSPIFALFPPSLLAGYGTARFEVYRLSSSLVNRPVLQLQHIAGSLDVMRFVVSLLFAFFGLSTLAPAQNFERTHPIRVSTGDFGAETLALINAYRTRKGLAALAPHPTLQALARQHSQYQASRRRLSHDGFRQRSARAAAAGLTRNCAENAGRDYRDARQLFSGWRNSSGHHRILLLPHLRYAGVSVVGRFSTFFACG
jgi:hypothetical protein